MPKLRYRAASAALNRGCPAVTTTELGHLRVTPPTAFDDDSDFLVLKLPPIQDLVQNASEVHAYRQSAKAVTEFFGEALVPMIHDIARARMMRIKQVNDVLNPAAAYKRVAVQSFDFDLKLGAPSLSLFVSPSHEINTLF